MDYRPSQYQENQEPDRRTIGSSWNKNANAYGRERGGGLFPRRACGDPMAEPVPLGGSVVGSLTLGGEESRENLEIIGHRLLGSGDVHHGSAEDHLREEYCRRPKKQTGHCCSPLSTTIREDPSSNFNLPDYPLINYATNYCSKQNSRPAGASGKS